jgi:pimeloyl-ACP methyl ester carboxylesterase
LGFSENEIAVELRQVNGIRHWQYATHSREEFAGLPGSPLLDNLTSNQRFRHRIGIRGGQLLDDSSRLVGQWRIPVSSGRNFNQVLQSLDSGTVTQEGLVRVEGDLEANTMRPSELRQLCNDLRRRIGGRVLLLLHDSFGTTEQMIDSLGQEFIRRAEREYVAVLGFDHWSLQRSSIEIADQLARELSALFQTGESGMKRPANTIDIIGFGRGGLVGRMLAEQHNQSAGEQPTISELIRNVALVGTPSFNSRAVSSDQWGLMADQLANNVHQDAHGYYAKMSATYAQLAALSEFHAPASLAKKAASFLLDDVPPLKLRSPDGISYCAVAAAYAPAAEVTASRIIHEYCHSAPHEFGEKQSLFLPGDLVVSTDDVWARTRQVSDVRETDDGGLTWVKNKVYWIGIPSLLIEPTDKTYYSNMAVPEDCVPIRVPKNTRRVEQNGVHHANLLSMPHCHDFLMSHLFPQD